jgi:hypothetical protein
MLENAIKRKRDEIAELEHVLEVKREVLRELIAESESGPKPAPTVTGSKGSPPTVTERASSPSNGVVSPKNPMPQNVSVILRARGGAMTIPQIRDKLEAAGVTSDDLRGAVASALHRRSDLFEKVGRGTFKLRGAGHGSPPQN